MSGPVRYLMLASHVPPTGSGGGIVRYTVELAAALARRPDVELHVLTTAQGAEFFTPRLGADRVHLLPRLPTVARSVVERFLSDHARGFDVVHGTKHLLPRRVGGARRVLTVHDMLLMDRPGDFPAIKRRLLRTPYLGSIRDADLLLCVSRATKDRLLHHVPDAAPHVRVVGLAMSTALRDARPAPVAALTGRRFALVVGDASARKNLAAVVAAWPTVRAAVPDAVLAVVGPPAWGSEQHGAGWAKLVAQGAVLPLGHVADDELSWCYRHASAVLCPSLMEGFGLPVIEAIAFDATVVTSEDPALTEAADGRAVQVAAGDTDGWANAVIAALRPVPDAGRSARDGVRDWDEVAAETLDAVRAMAGTG